MDSKEALEVIREAQNEMIIWADLDAEVQPLYEKFRQAADHFDQLLNDPGNEHILSQVHILAGRVSEKLQISYEDAKNMVVEVLGEDTTIGVVCGLLL